MPHKRNLAVGAGLFALIAGLMTAQRSLERAALAQAQGADQVPIYEVDPMWPKTPLPNKWVLGNIIGVDVDSRDNVWIVHRPHSLTPNEIPMNQKPPTGEDCCMAAPPILAFDQSGNLVKHWGPINLAQNPAGGPDWPDAEHGIFVDHNDNVWLGAGGDGMSKSDSALFKFSLDGKLIKRFGVKGQPFNSNDMNNFGQPADIHVDRATNEVWVADGYRNRRVIVLDAATGAYKRHWGAYGNKPDDTATTYDPNAPPSKQFRPPVHCVLIANDGMVYICDRGNDRIQVFTKDGKFVREQFIAKNTLSAGSVWDIDFSIDPEQRFLFLADGINHKIRILRRSDLQEVSSFGHHGRWAGGFYAAHSIAMDSKQNLYVGETWEGKRVQKFVYKGMGPRPARD
jgi:DNA-binding beta-propeller fold protein YncE